MGSLSATDEVRPQRWWSTLLQPGVIVIMFFVVISVFATGLLLGWAGFLLMFQGEGAFAYLCEPGELTCSAADLRLNLQFTVGFLVLTGCTLPSGILVDRCSPRLLVPLALLGSILSWVCLAAASALQGVWWNLLWPGILLMSLCSGIPHMAGFPLCALFPKWRGALTGLISGCYGISAITPIALHSVWTALGGTGSLVSLASAYAVLLGILFLMALALPASRCLSEGMRCEFAWSRGFYLEAAGDEEAVADEPRPTLKSQILSKDFLIVLFFAVARIHFLAFYLGAVNLHLRGIDESRSDSFTAIFGWVAPVGVLGGPFGSAWITNHSRGPNRAFKHCAALIALMQLLMAIVAWTEVLEYQVLAFFCYTFSQEITYASMFSWVGARFGLTNFGTLAGCAEFIGGLVVAATVNPIVEAASASARGFSTVFLVLAVIGLAASIPLAFLTEDLQADGGSEKPGDVVGKSFDELEVRVQSTE